MSIKANVIGVEVQGDEAITLNVKYYDESTGREFDKRIHFAWPELEPLTAVQRRTYVRQKMYDEGLPYSKKLNLEAYVNANIGAIGEVVI